MSEDADIQTRTLILGTAGHIDHGKTALIRALTGVNTDRLPEEKRRGMTIDLGFARWSCGPMELGIVDVPGHERFIRNMVAGAAGVDLVMLVIAADDSVMPQTREHLEILELLGIEHGLVVVTKCDLVDDELIELAEMEIQELITGSFLEATPIIHTSVVTGQGIKEVQDALTELSEEIDPKPPGDLFRMAVDRCFAMAGQGTVVTGSVISGSVCVGDEVQWLPGCRILRVRSLQAHDQRLDKVQRGQRAAIGLVGAHHRDIIRGHELATRGYLRPSRILTTQLRVLDSCPVHIKRRMRVRVHLGTSTVVATVSLLGRDRLGPGEAVAAQLLLAEPVVAVCGQPFVIRQLSPVMTLGGGHVLQPVALRIRKENAKALQIADDVGSTVRADRAAGAIRFYGTTPWTTMDLCRDANLNMSEAEPTVDQLETQGVVTALPVGHGQTIRLHRQVLAERETRVVEAIRHHHESYPLDTSMDRNQLAQQAGMKDEAPLLAAITDRLTGKNRLRVVGDGLALTGFAPTLTEGQRAAYDQLVRAYQSAGFRPPLTTELAGQLGISESVLRLICRLAMEQQELVHLGGSLFLHLQFEQQLRIRVGQALRDSDGLAISQIRELLDTSRKYAVPFCEYLDRIGVTKRRGDVRVLAEARSGASVHVKSKTTPG